MALRLFVAFAIAALLAGCAGLGEREPGLGADSPGEPRLRPDSVVTPFSAMDRLRSARAAEAAAASASAVGWRPWVLHPTKRPTRYQMVDLGGERVLEASADRSASGLLHPLDLDPASRPILEWRWRIDATIDGADIGERHADDAPVRIVLAFDGDKSSLPPREQMFFERVRLLAGHDMPYATLMYVWDNRRPPGSVARNPHTGRVQKLVIESGPAGVRQWRSYRRDIVADYRQAYGRDPGRLLGIGVLTDTDNTGLTARAWYGDIRLLARPD